MHEETTGADAPEHDDDGALDAENTDTEAGEPEPKAPRRGRGGLEADVKAVTDAWVTGEIDLRPGERLTPHRIAKLIKERDSLDKAPSVGAVQGVLSRWAEIGFAEVVIKPFAFSGYTEAASEQGLSALKQAAAERRKAERAAVKAAETATSDGDGDGGDAAEDAA